MPGAHIRGQFDCTDATLTNQTGPTLNLAGATLGPLRLAPRIAWHSGYELRDTDWADLKHLHELDRRMNPRWNWGPEL
jgi:hypothetical protein